MENQREDMTCPLCKGYGWVYEKVNAPPARGTGYQYHTGEKLTVAVPCPIDGCDKGIIKSDFIPSILRT